VVRSERSHWATTTPSRPHKTAAPAGRLRWGDSSKSASELSGREVQVLGLVGCGATNAEISRALYISEGTARNHVSMHLRKPGLRDRTQLAIYAVEHG
jgi:DNA-binding NarL/FixJ family response regulator